MRLCLIAVAVFLAIPDAGKAEERLYGRIRGWEVSAGFEGTRHVSCTATRRQGAQDMAIMRDDRNMWRIRLSGPEIDASHPGLVEIDGRQTPARIDAFGADLYFAASRDLLEAIRAGNSLRVVVPGLGETDSFPLFGTAAATAKIDECFNLRGRSPSGDLAGRGAPDALAPGSGCPIFGTVASREDGILSQVTFVNQTERLLSLFWIDTAAVPVEMAQLSPGDEIRFDASTGHLWLVRGQDGACLGGVIETPRSGGHLYLR